MVVFLLTLTPVLCCGLGAVALYRVARRTGHARGAILGAGGMALASAAIAMALAPVLDWAFFLGMFVVLPVGIVVLALFLALKDWPGAER